MGPRRRLLLQRCRLSPCTFCATAGNASPVAAAPSPPAISQGPSSAATPPLDVTTTAQPPARSSNTLAWVAGGIGRRRSGRGRGLHRAGPEQLFGRLRSNTSRAMKARARPTQPCSGLATAWGWRVSEPQLCSLPSCQADRFYGVDPNAGPRIRGRQRGRNLLTEAGDVHEAISDNFAGGGGPRVAPTTRMARPSARSTSPVPAALSAAGRPQVWTSVSRQPSARQASTGAALASAWPSKDLCPPFASGGSTGSGGGMSSGGMAAPVAQVVTWVAETTIPTGGMTNPIGGADYRQRGA